MWVTHFSLPALLILRLARTTTPIARDKYSKSITETSIHICTARRSMYCTELTNRKMYVTDQSRQDSHLCAAALPWSNLGRKCHKFCERM